MTWRMPAETAQHERTWMAFPRPGLTLGDDPASAEEAYAAWTAVAHAVAEFEPVTMVVDPIERDRARRMLSRRHRAARGAARRLLDARHGRDVRARRRAARRARRRRLDLQRLGRAEVVDLGQGPRDRPLRHGCRGRRARVVHARERGRRRSTSTARAPCSSPRPCSSTRAATRTPTRRASRRSSPAPSAPPTVIWLPRGLTRDYEDFGTRGHVDMVATIPSPGTLLLHEQPNPEHPDHEVMREPSRLPVRADGCRGPALRDHRPARPRGAPRRRGLRRLELREPPRRERRRDRVRLRRGASGCRGARAARRRLPRSPGRDRRCAADLRPRRRHPLHHAAAAGGGAMSGGDADAGFDVVEASIADLRAALDVGRVTSESS